MRKPLGIFIIVLSFFCLAATFPSKPVIIRGKVADAKTLKSLAKARVELLSLSGWLKAESLTDFKGNYELSGFSIPLNGEYHILRVSKEGYLSKSSVILLKNVKIIYFFNINLLRKLNPPPIIKSITPTGNSVFLAGARIGIKVIASGPYRCPLEYRFSIGGAIKQGWSYASTYSWQTSASDIGYTGIKCEVRYTGSLTASKEITYRIINPTIEGVLEKIAANYAGVQDLKADMVFSSTLNASPFGETEYCRYYFKAPDKEKTETYSDSTRNTKTDVIIINGSTMHLIDPVKNIKEGVDLLADAGVDSAEFNQVDIYYNPELFLSRHTVTRNDSGAALANMVITLDVLPETTNKIYDQLSISVDYGKGIIKKLCIYRKNTKGELELVQQTDTIEAGLMPNGSWLPVKMAKTPNLSSGALISTLVYENPQVNTGLTDSDFDPDKQ